MHVRIYTDNRDPFSDMLKSILKVYGISFENIEVSRDNKKFKEMVELSGQQKTPVMIVNGKVYIGFDRELIKAVLGIQDQKITEVLDINQQKEAPAPSIQEPVTGVPAAQEPHSGPA